MSDPFAELSPPYSTIVIDPPWEYATTKGITRRTGHQDVSAERHYSTMTNAEIAAMPVESLAAANAQDRKSVV